MLQFRTIYLVIVTNKLRNDAIFGHPVTKITRKMYEKNIFIKKWIFWLLETICLTYLYDTGAIRENLVGPISDRKKTTGSHWFGHFSIPNPWIWCRNPSILAKFHKLWKARSPSWDGVRGCSLIYFEALGEYYRLRYSFLENRVFKIFKSRQTSRRISENLRSGDVIHPTV